MEQTKKSKHVPQIDVSTWSSDIIEPAVLVFHQTDGGPRNTTDKTNAVDDPGRLSPPSGTQRRHSNSGSSTPKKVKTMNRRGMNSLPISPFLKPDGPRERLSQRFRSFSQTSDASVSDAPLELDHHPEKTKKKNKKAYEAKLISSDGSYFLDRAKTCVAHYIEEFIEETEAENLMSKVTHSMDNYPSKHTLVFDSTIGEDLDDFTEMATHYVTKVEKSLAKVFELGTSIKKVIVRNLSNYDESIPYEDLGDTKDCGPNPVVAMLAVGVARQLQIKSKSAKKVTHKVPLHSGSMCIFSGESSMRFLHSVPKVKGNNCPGQHMLLFFIGTPSVEVVSEEHTPSDTNIGSTQEDTSDCPTTSEADTSVDGEVEEFSIYTTEPPVNEEVNFTPKIVISSPSQEPPLTKPSLDTRTDLTFTPPMIQDPNHRPSKSDCTILSDRDALDLLHEDHDNTVIRRPPLADSNLLLGETLLSCVNNLPVDDLNRELLRHGYPTEGSSIHRRYRLSVILCTLIGKLSTTSKTPPPEPPLQPGAHYLNGIEKEVASLSSTISALSREVRQLQDEMKSPEPIKAKTNEDRETHGLCKQSLHSLQQLKTQFDDTCEAVKTAQDNATDILQSVKETKSDLEKWSESIFCKEDSTRIKAIYDFVNWDFDADKTSLPNATDPVVQPRSSSTVPGHFPESVRQEDPHSRRAPVVNYTMAVTKTSTNPQQTKSTPSTKHHQAPPISLERAPPKKIFKTVLITDSIMRHIYGKEDLGVNHELTTINKRDATGLLNHQVQKELKEVKPDFIYVHLGINDLNRGGRPAEVIECYANFIMFRDTCIPSSRIIFSLPLFTTNTSLKKDLNQIRRWTEQLVNGVSEPCALKDRHTHVQRNSNFNAHDGGIIRDLLTKDGIHPSSSGERELSQNIRYCIHTITRAILNKPRRSRASSGTPRTQRI